MGSWCRQEQSVQWTICFPLFLFPDWINWAKGKIERDGAPAQQVWQGVRAQGKVQNWNSLLQRQMAWRQFTRTQEKWEILQNTECYIHFRQQLYPDSGWYWVFYKPQAASQRWGCLSWNCAHLSQNVSEQKGSVCPNTAGCDLVLHMGIISSVSGKLLVALMLSTGLNALFF